MMSFSAIPIWKEAPFLRLVVPLTGGIIFQWYLSPSIPSDWLIFIAFSCFVFLFSISRQYVRFVYGWVYGVLLQGSLFFLGALLTAYQCFPNQKNCIKNTYKKDDLILARLVENPVEKSHSWKVEAAVQYDISKKGTIISKGSIIIYFQKTGKRDNFIRLAYGDLIAFKKPLVPIANSGNPGAFDVERACLFQGIYYQVYLNESAFVHLSSSSSKDPRSWLLHVQERIIAILRKYIPGKTETGLAEALLIGYKNDLDPELVRSYSNTGVVHIIAISGLHLALIYGLLNFLLKPIAKTKTGKWIKPMLMLGSIWLFSFLSGASASVLRAAVMFTCIIVGETISKQHSIYNTLAASAFLLLSFHPFWLWDIGFQLSYSAVLSIVLFMKPVYHLLYFKSKIPDMLWKSLSVSIAAQLLTMPCCIYYFHQFPNYFLISNLIAVPLSSLILLGELFICGLGFFSAVASPAGHLLSWMISLLNHFISWVAGLPFSTWTPLQISLLQCILLYATLAALAIGLMQKNRRMFIAGLMTCLIFTIIRCLAFRVASRQQLLIVYNIPHTAAVDCIRGTTFYYSGDTVLQNNPFLQQYYLRPARMMYRISHDGSLEQNTKSQPRLFQWTSKKMMMIDQSNGRDTGQDKPFIDIAVLSANARVSLRQLSSSWQVGLWVFDSSNTVKTNNRWKKECEELGLNYYCVADKGAFVMNMD